jgi:hypothetical protein
MDSELLSMFQQSAVMFWPVMGSATFQIIIADLRAVYEGGKLHQTSISVCCAQHDC